MSKCNHTFHRLGGIEDCPVCNPQPPAKPPREFWIAGRHDGSLDAFECPCDDYSGYYKAVHVIEKSYASRLEQELAFVKTQWKQTSDLLEQERNRLTAELADVRKERDEFWNALANIPNDQKQIMNVAHASLVKERDQAVKERDELRAEADKWKLAYQRVYKSEDPYE